MMMSTWMVTTAGGHNLSEVVSALQKAVRRGQVDDSIYWAVDMHLSGFGGYCWKRLKVMVSEDVGPADRYLPATIDALFNTYTKLAKQKDKKHSPERLPLVHAVYLIATAPKSRIVDHALLYHYLAHKRAHREIPDYALDMHTRRGKQMKRGLEHFFREGGRLENEQGDDPYRQLCIEALKNPEPTEQASETKPDEPRLF